MAQVQGSGTSGAIVAADLRTGPPAAATEAAPSAPARGEKAATMRRAVAELMARSSREIPHYHLSTTIDMATAKVTATQVKGAIPVPRAK